MKADRPIPISETVFCALTHAFNRYTRWMLPSPKSCWGEALILEQQRIATPKERLIWAAGGAYMTTMELLKTSAADRWTWFAAFLLGTVCALVDLHSAKRWPYIVLLFCSVLVLTLWQPKWPWRWTIAVAACPPITVIVSRDWGPM